MVGTIIKELRTDKAISQQAVANAIKISRSVLSQYENNQVEPTGNVIKRLAEFFDVSADYLLGLEDDFGGRVPAQSLSASDADEQRLLNVYRGLSPDMKNTLWGLLATWTPAARITSAAPAKKT